MTFRNISLYVTYDAERQLTFDISGRNKDNHAALSLTHDDGSGLVAVAWPQDFSPEFRKKINELEADRAESWLIAMPGSGPYKIGGIVYSETQLAALLQEGADVYIYQGRPSKVALCELNVKFR